MNRYLFWIWKGVFFSIFFLTTFFALTHAAGRDLRIQGTVMELDLKKGIIVVNEKTFVCDERTTFHNEKGASLSAEKLKLKGWVYIEGEYDNAYKRWVARKIYSLPKRIDHKEKHLYPFIQQD